MASRLLRKKHRHPGGLMLSIFKKLFGKSEPKAVVAPAPVVPRSTPSAMIPTIEVAHLSLAAIIARFPDELKPLLAREPDATATVALPLPTILKQLPTGSVKMSLASLHRQAHGLLKPLPPGDKRSVEVPLAEVFRHVRPDAFRRRSEQRTIEVPENGFNLFGDSSNPFSRRAGCRVRRGAESAAEPEPQVLDLTSDVALESAADVEDGFNRWARQTVHRKWPFQKPAPGRQCQNRRRAQRADRSSAAGLHLPVDPGPQGQPVSPVAPPRPSAIAPAARPRLPPIPPRPRPRLLPRLVRPRRSPLTALSADWPEEIRAEIAALDPATQVALPMDDVSASLAKGRVNFSWQQIHSWLEPESTAPSAVPGDTALPLPLKVVAPAFLAASKKPATERKSVTMDQSIPALFSHGRPPAEKPPVAEAAPVAEPAAESVAGAVAQPVATLAPVPASAPTPETPAVAPAPALRRTSCPRPSARFSASRTSWIGRRRKSSPGPSRLPVWPGPSSPSRKGWRSQLPFPTV